MKTMKNSKKNETRVLITSLSIAAVAVAGATFAWFTSKDEVTNRLTASANYGVSIVEDFTPPENMTPGQEVNKDVSIVNTGNIDALVRVQIENMLKIKKYSGVPITLGTASTTTHGTDPDTYGITDFAATYPSIPAGQTAVELSPAEYTDSNGNKHANEVSLIQAGGELVVAAGKAVDVNDQAVKSGDDTNLEDYHGDDQFKPTENGLYIFRRTVYEGAGNADVKYSGYWYKDGKYYALATEDTATDSTVYLPAGAVTEGAAGTGSVVTALDASAIQIKTTTEADATATAGNLSCELGKLTVSGTTETWAAATGTPDKSNATHIKVTYDPTPDTTTPNPTTDDVVFYIALAGDWSDNWAYVDDDVTPETTAAIGSAIGHFYLKDDLEAGATSPELISSVTMSQNVTQQAFVDLTYDINVVLESVQITFDADDNEKMPTNIPFAGGATGSATVEDGEITAIAWS